MALDLKAELEALVEALAAASVPFAICGGVAVTIHGAAGRPAQGSAGHRGARGGR